MKKLISFALLAAFGVAIVGCEASGRIGHDDSDDQSTSYKKTTVEHPNGDTTTVKTETHHDD